MRVSAIVVGAVLLSTVAAAGTAKIRLDVVDEAGGELSGGLFVFTRTDDPGQRFFGGRGVDDLFWPAHLNFKFFDMTPLPTFACHDVMKNPQVENDFARFDTHLRAHSPETR